MAEYFENDFLDSFENSEEYLEAQQKTENALDKQINKILTAGLLIYAFDKFSGYFSGAKELPADTTQIERSILNKVNADLITKIQDINGYNKFIPSYLNTVMNEAGNFEIKKFSDIPFSLKSFYYQTLINERARDLYSTINGTTTKDMAQQLINGMRRGETKAQLEERLLGMGFPEKRAKLIVRTETAAATEFIRHEVAKLNGVQMQTWRTTHDESTCFPKRTLITIENGYKEIQNLKVGDKVLTRAGYRKIIATSKRLYDGDMTYIKAGKNKIISTSNHPIWRSKKGWLQAGDFEVGDFVQSSTNKNMRVTNITNFSIGNSNSFPSIFFQKIIFFFIPFFIPVPVSSICLQSNSEGWNQKIYTISSKFSLLNIFNTKSIQTISKNFFKGCFSSKFSITRKRAELSNRYCFRLYPELFSAFFTLICNSWSSACFGTVPTGSRISIKDFTTSFTRNISKFFISVPTTATTNSVPIGNTFINLKIFCTNWACFCNFFGSNRFFVAITGTEFSIKGNPFFRGIKRFFAIFTNNGRSCFGIIMITGIRTKRMVSFYFLRLIKIFSALKTFIIKHGNQLMINFSILYHWLFSKSINVYNIQVEDCPEFYANDILVHNCKICNSMNNKSIAISDKYTAEIYNVGGDLVTSFDVAYPPVHPNCRCWIQYDYKEFSCDNFLSGIKKAQDFYDSNKDAPADSCVNTEAVWAGGNTKEGDDAEMLKTYSDDLKDKKDLQDTWKAETWKNLDQLSKEIEEVYYRSNDFSVLKNTSLLRTEAERLGLTDIRKFTNTELELGMARANLSDQSFVQLLKNLNLSDTAIEKYGLANVISMNKAEALVQDSALKTTLFHGTGKGSFDSIYKSNKFLVGEAGSNGMGAYFTPTYTDAKAFGEEVVKVKLNIDKIKTFADSDALVNYYLKGIEKDDSLISMEYSTAITKLVKADGYNALQLKDSGWVTVFDPDNIILFK